jgi:hypothetical protein
VSRVIMSARVREGSPRGSMVKLSGLSGSSHGGVGIRRDLEWWRTVPTQHNGWSIYKPIETAYLHADSSDYGWRPC